MEKINIINFGKITDEIQEIQLKKHVFFYPPCVFRLWFLISQNETNLHSRRMDYMAAFSEDVLRFDL